MKVGKYMVPFERTTDGKWSMMEYTTADEGEVGKAGGYLTPQAWRENVPFEAKLALTGTWRGRSAARVGVVNTRNGDRYSMGLQAFYEAVIAFGVDDGTIRGTWVFRKQGANYGIYPLKESA